MPDGTALVLCYDGSFDGLLSAVFQGYLRKAPMASITFREEVQTGFGREIIQVETQEEESRRVEQGILKKAGSTALALIETGFWSGQEDKDTLLYRYIQAALQLGPRVYNDLSHPDVLAMEYLCRNIRREQERMMGFVRFSQLENGVFFSSIAPRNSLVPLLMPHFSDRFNIQPFLLQDTEHKMVGVYDGEGWYLVETDQLHLPGVSPEEEEYRRMWRGFYDAVTVEARRSSKRRRNMMPKWYWKNLPEFDPRYDPEQIQLRREKAEREAAVSTLFSSAAPIFLE